MGIKKKIKEKVQYVKEHKTETVLAAITVVSACCTGALIINNKELKKQIIKKDQIITQKDKIIKACYDKITNLVNRCTAQESSYKHAISDGLRHGSSFAGKEMTNRKKRLNSLAVN